MRFVSPSFVFKWPQIDFNFTFEFQWGSLNDNERVADVVVDFLMAVSTHEKRDEYISYVVLTNGYSASSLFFGRKYFDI